MIILRFIISMMLLFLHTYLIYKSSDFSENILFLIILCFVNYVLFGVFQTVSFLNTGFIQRLSGTFFYMTFSCILMFFSGVNVTLELAVVMCALSISSLDFKGKYLEFFWRIPFPQTQVFFPDGDETTKAGYQKAINESVYFLIGISFVLFLLNSLYGV